MLNRIMLNQTFTGKIIGLLQNINIHKNIYYDNTAIQGGLLIAKLLSFQYMNKIYL